MKVKSLVCVKRELSVSASLQTFCVIAHAWLEYAKKLMRTVLQSKFDDLYYYNKFLTTFMVFNFLSFLETSTKLCPQQLCSPYRKETASFTVGS